MKIIVYAGIFFSVSLVFSGCNSCRQRGEKTGQNSLNTKVMKEDFGTVDGKAISLYTLTNKNGIVVRITNFGAIITQIRTPDQNGEPGDIVLGFDSLEPYLDGHPYFGCIAGRYANRIAKGKFTLDGKIYTLAVNDGENHLHGGVKGFDKKVWEALEVNDTAGSGVAMTLLSPDGDEGYPGNLRVKVTYRLNDRDELSCLIEATTDKPTPVNLCNHTYFNLNGARNSILDHRLEIIAKHYTAVDDGLIPTGSLTEVANTPMDFTSPVSVGERIEQVKGGYDHNYVLVKEPGTLSLGARLSDTASGRTVEIYTTQPGIQFYSGNFLDGTLIGKGGAKYRKHWGLCLETQHFPDSPNQKDFPNTILRPGEKFRENTVYKFLVFRRDKSLF